MLRQVCFLPRLLGRLGCQQAPEEASAAYRTKAKELDHLLIAKQVVAVSSLGTPGPYESVLNGFGKVLAPVVGAFAEMPSDVHPLS